MASKGQLLLIQFKQIFGVCLKGERNRLRSIWNGKELTSWSNEQAPKQILVDINIEMQISINEGVIVFNVAIDI